jgi:predicted TPR repeat methyltransferase
MSKSFSEIHAATTTTGSPEIYAKWADTYDEEMKTNGLHSYVSVFSMWEMFHAEESSTHRLLDIGCGTGLGGQYYCNKRPSLKNHIHGCDLAPAMIEKAKEKNCYFDLNVADLNKELPYEAGFFDSVCGTGIFMPGYNLSLILEDM